VLFMCRFCKSEVSRSGDNDGGGDFWELLLLVPDRSQGGVSWGIGGSDECGSMIVLLLLSVAMIWVIQRSGWCCVS